MAARGAGMKRIHWLLTGSVALGACGGAESGDPQDPLYTLDPADGVAIHIQATTAEFPHSDGLSSMTARAAGGAIRSLSLLSDRSDPAPLRLFDYGANSAKVSYDDGAETEAGVVAVDTFAPGQYKLARLVQAYSRYDIDATYHENGVATPGRLESLMVMSDGTLIDGKLHNSGHYDWRFRVSGGEETGAMENVEIADVSFTAGAYALLEDGEWAVYFPIDVTLDDVPAAGSRLNILVNMDHSFRWVDTVAPDWEAGVYDFSSSVYETVVRFGGNDFQMDWD